MASASGVKGFDTRAFQQDERKKDVRLNNFVAAKAVATLIRTSLGPRGMDKMIVSPNGDVTISNDGATIMSKMEVQHPAARMLVDLSKAQDIEAGDGTTSVVVICGALLEAAEKLLLRGIHPTKVAESFLRTSKRAVELLKTRMAVPVDLADRASLLKSATTSLYSKVVSQHASLLAPIAVDAVLRVIDPAKDTNVDLGDIKQVKKVGGTMDDIELVDGLVFPQKAVHTPGAPVSVKNAKIGLVQFCLSAPKTNMDNSVVISDYAQMDRILREERNYILGMIKKIKASGCTVLLIQKSILRDALSDLAASYLAKAKIMAVRDIERGDIEFISKTIGAQPIASIEAFSAEKLGSANLVEEEDVSDGSKLVRVTGVPHTGRTVTVLVRGSNNLVLDEAERSLHDALCVVRSLVKMRFMVPGGGAPEIELSLRLEEFSRTLTGVEQECVRAYADALEVVPYTLAENAGLQPIQVVTELRNRHANGEKTTGINVRKGRITDILEENVVQPLLVTASALTLATENVCALLKIDDIIRAR